MKNFQLIHPDQLQNKEQYEPIEEGIFNDIKDDGGFATHRLAMSMTIEEGENSQYPLEDILDHFFVHVEEFLSNDQQHPHYIFGGDLDSLQKLKTIIGKRAYNKEFTDDEGQQHVKLIVE